jgi:hypothetical protein
VSSIAAYSIAMPPVRVPPSKARVIAAGVHDGRVFIHPPAVRGP